MVKSPRLSVPNQVPIDQEIGVESLGLNDFQLFIHALLNVARGLRIPLVQVVLAQLAQQEGVLGLRARVRLQVGRGCFGTHGNENGTGFQQLLRSLQQHGGLAVGLFPLRTRHPNFTRVAGFVGPDALQKGVEGHRAQNTMGLEVGSVPKGEGHPGQTPRMPGSPLLGSCPKFPRTNPQPSARGQCVHSIPGVYARKFSIR